MKGFTHGKTELRLPAKQMAELWLVNWHIVWVWENDIFVLQSPAYRTATFVCSVGGSSRSEVQLLYPTSKTSGFDDGTQGPLLIYVMSPKQLQTHKR